VLEVVLEGQNLGKPKGIGFNCKVLNKKQQSRNLPHALVDFGIISKQKPDKEIKTGSCRRN